MQGCIPDQPLDSVSFVALDTETTGLSCHHCQLVEVAAVRFDLAGNVSGRYAQLIDPCCRIPPAVTAVHGITNAMVAGMPTIDQVLPAFFAFLDAQPSLLVIHNAPFDIGFLSEASRRVGNLCPRHPIVDTLWLARKRVQELQRHRLDLLVAHFGQGTRAAHRALGDSEVLAQIFLKMLHREPAIRTLGELQQYARLKYFDSPDDPPTLPLRRPAPRLVPEGRYPW